MNRVLRNKIIVLSSLFPSINFDDKDFSNYKEARGLYIEDPWSRVKSIFLKDEYGALHPELQSAIRSCHVGACIGAFYGAFIESKVEVDKFRRTSDTSTFINKKEAYKMLNNRNIIGILRGIVLWAPRFAFFCGAFEFISSCLELYRNKIRITDNSLAGFSVGALCKFSYGIKGMISGGVVGGVLGTLYGMIMWSLYAMTGVDRLEIKYAQFAFMKYKEQEKKHATTEKSKLFENLEKSGIHSAHIPDPLNALNDAEENIQKAEEIEPN